MLHCASRIEGEAARVKLHPFALVSSNNRNYLLDKSQERRIMIAHGGSRSIACNKSRFDLWLVLCNYDEQAVEFRTVRDDRGEICSLKTAIMKNCLITWRLRWNCNASHGIAVISQTIPIKMRQFETLKQAKLPPWFLFKRQQQKFCARLRYRKPWTVFLNGNVALFRHGWGSTSRMITLFSYTTELTFSWICFELKTMMEEKRLRCSQLLKYSREAFRY